LNIRILPAARRAFVKERNDLIQEVRPVSGAETFRLLRSHGDVRYALTMVAVAFAYFVSAKLGLSLAFATKQVSAFWPPTGIALAALLLIGYRAWPGIFLGAFLANATSGETLLTAAGIAAGNMLTGVVGAFLLRSRYKFHIPLERTRDVLALVIVAMISTLVSASLGTLNLLLAKLVTWNTFGSVWLVWWVGDTLGIVLLAPFLLSWVLQPRVQWRSKRLVEYVALFGALMSVGYFVFARTTVAGPPYPLMTYAAFPFLIWAAFRFEQREVVTSTLLIASIATWGAIHGNGPFGFGSLDDRLIAVDTFVGVMGITALLLGAATAERRQSQERLRCARDEMEQRVQERTAQLEQANHDLSEFSHSMSHDLRAPLRAINAFSEMLTQRYAAALDTDGVRLIGGIARNTQLMGHMLEDYLRLTDLRNESLRPQEVDMQALVREVISDLSKASAGNAQFQVRELPVAICDRTLIREVWVNLVDNALKFSRQHERPSIEIGSELSDDAITYFIKDNGVGFDMQWSDQLFKVFQRLHPREYEGMGTGLAVVSSIVLRHAGRVYAHGEAGKGATFYFALPRLSPE